MINFMIVTAPILVELCGKKGKISKSGIWNSGFELK